MATTKSIKGTKTERNILLAYLAESAAYTRYTYYAQKADKDQYFPVGVAFRNTAENELHHGKVFFKMLEGGQLDAPMSKVDCGIIGTTTQNLVIAAAEELSEGVDQYTNAAAVAKEEGFDEIAEHFLAIASIEKRHMERFKAYEQQINDGNVWKRPKPIKWQCLVCGYIFEGTEPPKVCPACDHPYQHYIALDMDQL